MPGGRPENTKNSAGHGAGGSRNNSGRKKKKSEDTEDNDEMQNTNKKRKPTPEEATQFEEKKQREKERRMADREESLKRKYNESIEKLREMAEDLPNSSMEGEGDDVDDFLTYEDDDTESNPVIQARRKHQKRRYVPPENSPLFKEMEALKKRLGLGKAGAQFRANINCAALRKKFWHDSNTDAVISFRGTSPNSFYSSRFRAFAWLPFSQFDKMLNMKSLACIRCGERKGSLKLDEIIYRPMFHFDQQVWVLHHTVLCKCCGKRRSTIDSKFISQFPTVVVQRFPFVAPIRGPGVHVSMIHQFCSLTTKQVMFGTYSDTINELLKIKYYEDMAAYYELAVEEKRGGDRMMASDPTNTTGDERIFEVSV